MTAKIIDGRLIAETLRAEIAREATDFRNQTGIVPHLTAVLVGDDPASAVYVKNKHLACEKAGFKSTLVRLPAETTQQELLHVVERLNADPTVHGILVQLPLPKGLAAQPILDAVSPLKDVDCFHPENVGLLSQGRPRFLPCTPSGVQQILIHEQVTVPGAHVVIVGRSDIVGRPLALMLLQKGQAADATVTVCHSRTKDLAAVARTADILVAAIGQPEFITADMVKPGAVVIDVGINRVGERLVGDVAFAAVSEVASAITPVPRGVGPMTITMLLANTLKAAKLAS
ncbi:MAG: bifunctional 5,10-methylenetetrahydrofolate dehydrogenase/5,10-methenyltetrahydrofolate cyclohydrolase [Planctomycetes bacterium]|nr:bifunctional 5,10-methylenetetrahydrofolate dehydrogenase/5,10-methenyltetrahydrofolate cyclohydrolase [Planctomycetota bacterium]